MRKRNVSQKRLAHLPEMAFQRLRQAILTAELKEGERVRETKLAREWNMGITPMREAVRRMAELGYLVLRPNHAPIVRKLSAEDIRQIYVLRELLECHALKSAWKTIKKQDFRPFEEMVKLIETTTDPKVKLQAQFDLDTALHQLWISQCDNVWLSSTLERLLIYRPNIMNLVSSSREFVAQAYAEHKGILKALQEGRYAQARNLLGQHIRKSGAALVALTESSATAAAQSLEAK